VAVELTKFHERHYRDQVVRVREQIEQESEGSRFKGEITLVIAPRDETESK
jgi:16S rRNA C1402 (ribose-2'-O) methylase RsmI